MSRVDKGEPRTEEFLDPGFLLIDQMRGLHNTHFFRSSYPLPAAIPRQYNQGEVSHDSDKFVRWVEERGGIAVIPSRINAKHPRHTDWHTCKERHLVENLFLKLKNNRRFATRYEKKALYFHAVVCLACSLVWLL